MVAKAVTRTPEYQERWVAIDREFQKALTALRAKGTGLSRHTRERQTLKELRDQWIDNLNSEFDR